MPERRGREGGNSLRAWGREFWRPFEELASGASWPALDMVEDDKNVKLRVDLPGMDPKDVDVEVSGNTLTIRGNRQDEWTENQRGVVRRERVSGSFMRSVTLPEYVDAGQIDARYERGTLTITAPKAPGRGPQRVAITGSEQNRGQPGQITASSPGGAEEGQQDTGAQERSGGRGRSR